MLVGCGAPVDSERLGAIAANGMSPEDAARTTERLERALARGDDAQGRADRFGDMAATAGSVTPGALVQAALARNSRIGAAAEDIALADAERMRAVFGYLPQVTIGYQRSEIDQEVIRSDNVVFQAGTAQYPVTTLTARIDQPIIDLSRIFAIQHARNARTQAEVDYLATVRAVVYEVLDTYVMAAQSAARARALNSRMAILDRQVSAQGALAETGLGIASAPSALRSERAGIASEAAMEMTRYADALGRLSFLTGSTITQVAPLRATGVSMSGARGMNVDALVARGLQENPAVMSAALAVVGADVQRQQALAADFSPVLTAYALLEREDREASRFGGGSLTQDQTVGVQLTVPLFNAQGRGYEIGTANVRLRRQGLEYNALVRELETDIRTTHARLLQLAQASGQAATATREAGVAVRAEQDRVAVGESSDFATAARELRLAQSRELQDVYSAEYLRAWFRLQYLTGVDMRAGL